MVYIGIPKNYTASPSSFAGTPSLTINYEATQDLDSTNAFEGTSTAVTSCLNAAVGRG
jgi:S-adenosylmethionine decarboxylase